MTEQILGRSLEDIDKGFLETFFAQERTESDVFELKSYYDRNEGNEDSSKAQYKTKERGILKSVCALLNSSGGLIIWGAPIGKIQGEIKIFSGNLSPVPKLIDKDSFINTLSDKTVPLPSNIKFKPVHIEGDKYVYIIEVIESQTKPHQYDHSYYMRLDGQTREAPHHYIEALFKQIKFPHIEGYVKMNDASREQLNIFKQNKTHTSYYYFINIKVLLFNFTPFQNEENISFRLHTSKGKFQGDSNLSRTIGRDGKEVREENSKPVLYFGEVFEANFSIRLEESEVDYCGYTFNIILAFGGKFSPQKVSSYKINLSQGITHGSYNDLLEIIHVNKSHYEHQKELGITRESALKEILGIGNF